MNSKVNILDMNILHWFGRKVLKNQELLKQKSQGHVSIWNNYPLWVILSFEKQHEQKQFTHFIIMFNSSISQLFPMSRLDVMSLLDDCIDKCAINFKHAYFVASPYIWWLLARSTLSRPYQKWHHLISSLDKVLSESNYILCHF